MIRCWLTLCAGLCLAFTLGLASASGQDDKKSEEKKKEETILGKTVGEWIKILREDERLKWRRGALIALEGSNSAGRAALPAILETLEKDKEPQIRVDVVLLLGRIGKDSQPAFKGILNALQSDKSNTVREAAATVIGDGFTDKAGDYVIILAEALKDPHAGTRIAVATALRNMGESAKPALPVLLAAAKNPKEETFVRVAAVHVLSRHGKENAGTLPLLLELVVNKDTPAALREIAIDGLGHSGSDSVEVIAASGRRAALPTKPRRCARPQRCLARRSWHESGDRLAEHQAALERKGGTGGGRTQSPDPPDRDTGEKAAGGDPAVDERRRDRQIDREPHRRDSGVGRARRPGEERDPGVDPHRRPGRAGRHPRSRKQGDRADPRIVALFSPASETRVGIAGHRRLRRRVKQLPDFCSLFRRHSS